MYSFTVGGDSSNSELLDQGFSNKVTKGQSEKKTWIK